MTLRPIEEVVAELKTPLYQILDKLYADKSYIDCAYDDIAKLFRTTLAQRDVECKEKWREEIERKVVELFLDFEMKGNRAEHIDVVAIVNDTLSTK